GIVALRQAQEPDLASLARLGQRLLERAPGRRAARAIAVESEHHRGHQAKDAAEVLGRGRGAERGEGVVDPGLVQPHDVHIALDDHYSCEAGTRAARLVDAVELAPLVKQHGLGRVQEGRELYGIYETRRSRPDRKSTRLNSSHLVISYAVFCLKKKKKK